LFYWKHSADNATSGGEVRSVYQPHLVGHDSDFVALSIIAQLDYCLSLPDSYLSLSFPFGHVTLSWVLDFSEFSSERKQACVSIVYQIVPLEPVMAATEI
jgi:hypothetical protein